MKILYHECGVYFGSFQLTESRCSADREDVISAADTGLRRCHGAGVVEFSIDSTDKVCVSVFSESVSVSMPMNFESVIHHARGQL